jgi:general secretion pathway protein G
MLTSRSLESIRTRAGFTLVELLVVIAIIAVLTGIGLGSFISAQKKGRDAKRKGDLQNLTQALEVYLNDHNSYPVDSNGLIKGCGTAGSETACAWGAPFKLGDIYYVTQLPEDPTSGQQYYYESDGSYYVLYARLENVKDKDIPKNAGAPQVYQRTDGGETNCGSQACNYAQPSSNVTSLATTDDS